MSEVIFETRYVGAFARVAAIDVASGFEVSVMGPRGAGEPALQRLAAAKLARALQKRAAPAPQGRRRGFFA